MNLRKSMRGYFRVAPLAAASLLYVGLAHAAHGHGQPLYSSSFLRTHQIKVHFTKVFQG